MEETITDKSKKSEIYKAYDALLKEVRAMRKTTRKEEIEEVKKKEVVKEADKYSSEDIMKNITDLKLKVAKLFDDIGDKIVSEYKKFHTLQEASGIEANNLKERHSINVNADTLEALLLAQTKKTEEFEHEMAQKKIAFEQDILEKKLAWEKEQDIFENNRKEQRQQLEKERKREEDEYNYKLTQERRKIQDEYELEKNALAKELQEKSEAFEKEFAERESILAKQEEEIEDLRQQVELFPKKLEDALKIAEEKAIANLKMEHKFNSELKAKEMDGKLRLNEQIIAAQETKIKELQAHINQITQKSHHAHQQVQDIAIKAIEGAAGMKHKYEQYMTSQKESTKTDSHSAKDN